METQAGALLELLVAAIIVACVRVVLGVSVDVLRQILLLSKITPTHITNEPLETHVQGDQVALEAES